MAVAPSSTALGCGRDIDQVWDHLGAAPDAHELTCPFCQAARADLADLGRATQAMRDDNTTNPDLQPSSGVLDRILTIARAEVRRGRRLPLDQPGEDLTSFNTVSEQAVSAVVRRVGDRTRQIQIRRCALTLDDSFRGVSHEAERAARQQPDTIAGPVVADDPAATALASVDPDSTLRGVLDTGPAAVAVSLRVSVAHDAPILEASEQLRRAIVAAVKQEVGVDVSAVHIHVEDLHDD